MGFTLREILGKAIVERVNDTLHTTPECPTGKVTFWSKAEADQALKKINVGQRTKMTRFRCGYCERYHLGHRRGSIY
jgi:hypothetical protein